MKDLEQARNLLAMAHKDYRALTSMGDPETFAEEIFGFHVQQAVEKTLKAWLCYAGVAFPKMHDLEELAGLLDSANEELPAQFTELLDHTDFAVTFRYDAFPELRAGINREHTTALVSRLLDHVSRMLEKEGRGQ